ncbi:MAG: hypothetical protein JOZ41_22175 [Chloroflexi bacterium]|nr:hypothetical protein [Chloroflexota bacterium]
MAGKHELRRRKGAAPTSTPDARGPQSAVPDRSVAQPSGGNETGEPLQPEPAAPSTAFGFDFGAISILPSDPASRAAPHIVPTETHVRIQPAMPRWQPGEHVPVQRNGPAALEAPVPVLDIELDERIAGLKEPSPAQEARGHEEGLAFLKEPSPEKEAQAHEEGLAFLKEPQGAGREVAAELGQVVDPSKKNAAAIVMERLVEQGAGSKSQAQPSGLMPGFGPMVASKVSAVGSAALSGVKALGRGAWWLVSAPFRLLGWAGSGVYGLLAEAVLGLARWFKKQGPTNAAKFVGGTVAPPGATGGSALAGRGIWLAQQIRPAEHLAEVAHAAGHVLNPVGLVFTVLSFILNVRSALSSHLHFRNLEKLAKWAVNVDSMKALVEESDIDRELIGAVQFAAGQKSRKSKIKGLGALGGAAGVSGGTIGLLAAFGVGMAAAFPPLGIALAALGTGAALGIFAYRIYRSYLKGKGKKELKLGLTRERAAEIIHLAAVRVQKGEKMSRAQIEVIEKALKELKLTVELAAEEPRGIDRIMRKLKS